MITGIFYPDSGQIYFEGKKFVPTEDIPKIGYMPEERGLYKKMKVGEQALYLAQLKGLSRREAMKSLKEWFIKFEMQGWWNKKVNDLSKGMGQKLQFVTTVLHHPKLLILDEPFSGLDPVNSNLIKDEIFKLAQNGTTIIFSTHRMEQVEEICDHIVLVNKGKKILDGSVSQVKDDFKEHIFKVGFEELPAEFTSNSFEVVSSKGDFLNVKIHDDKKPSDVLQELLNHQASIISFNEVLPSLNEIFIRQVQELKSDKQSATIEH
jgi:ABC-2 type transport system ATP-binding protein